jgi:hypothetical protein
MEYVFQFHAESIKMRRGDWNLLHTYAYIYIHIHVCSVAVRTTLVHLVQIPNIGKCIQPIFRCQSHDMHVQFGFQFSVYFRGVLWPRTRINIQCCCLLVTFLLKPSAKLIESLKLKAFGEWRVVWLWESLQFCTRMGMEGALRFLAGTNADTLDAKFAFWVFSLPKIQAPLTSLPTFFPECKDDTHTQSRSARHSNLRGQDQHSPKVA